MLADSRARLWRERLGNQWRLHLAILVALWCLLGFLHPVGDPDLPRHLALAEWILTHRAFPFEEPWAWTRSGAPFFAYSWLTEVAQYGLFGLAGLTGLRVYNAILLGAAGAAIILLGSAARWRPWTVVLVALLHVGMATAFSGGQRPGMVLLVTVPVAWWAAYRVLDSTHVRWPLLVLAIANVVAANSHILFPAMAGPLLLLLTRPQVSWRRVALPAAVTVGSWLVSPYALVWPEVFRLNFGANPLFSYPTPIGELTPGFIAIARLRDPFAILPIGLALLPWIVAPRVSARERLLFGILWLGGLGIFGIAVRGLAIWWVLVLPLTAAAVEQIGEPSRMALHRAQLAATYVAAALLLSAVLRSDRASATDRFSIGPRSLPAPANPWVEPAARWIECHAGAEAGGRIFNTFDFGDYLVWRLPRHSVSLDGRNIFPDSVARAEGFALAASGAAPLGPWRAADMAIVPDIYPVAAVLDSASGWRRVLRSRPAPGAELTMGLWIRESWWSEHAAAALPDSAEVLVHRADFSYPCPHDADSRR